MSVTRCGCIVLVGRPNVGKSTLLNALLGEKVSIVTPRAQTTRRRVVGVLTHPGVQYIFLDTPGLHAGRRRRALNRRMNDAARNAMDDADVAVALVAAPQIGDEDHEVIRQLLEAGTPTIVAINQVDRVDDKRDLLPILAQLSQQYPQVLDWVPISASRGDNLDSLLAVLGPKLPESVFLYPDGMVTDQTHAQRAEEIIREKLVLRLHEELPYGVAVRLEHLSVEEGGLTRIHATIWIAQERHQGMVIGKGGLMLKDVGTAARRDLERLFDAPVYLELRVRVREDWPDDERALDEFGYTP